MTKPEEGRSGALAWTSPTVAYYKTSQCKSALALAVTLRLAAVALAHLDFVILSSIVIRHSTFCSCLSAKRPLMPLETFRRSVSFVHSPNFYTSLTIFQFQRHQSFTCLASSMGR
jgi:hypothetical protein